MRFGGGCETLILDSLQGFVDELRRESFEIFVLRRLEMIKKMSGVTRVAYLRYDDRITAWVLIAETMVPGITKMPGKYSYLDMPRPEFLQADRWIFEPIKNIGFDAVYPFLVDKEEVSYMSAIAVDDILEAREFSYAEKILMDKMGLFFKSAVLFKHYMLYQKVAAKRACEDTLTGLPNRRAWESAVDDLVRKGESAHFIIIDLDNFKKINDELGHHTGDGILKEAALILGKRENPRFYRVGGEEFAGIYSGETKSAEVEEIIKEAQRDFYNSDAIRRICPWPVTFSCGYSFFEAEMNPQIAWQAADMGTYFVKKRGKNGYKLAIIPPELKTANPDLTGKSIEPLLKIFCPE